MSAHARLLHCGGKGFFCLVGLLLSFLAGPTCAISSTPQVLILHTSFVSTEKFERLNKFAEREGVALTHVNVDDTITEELADAMSMAELVVLDVPRPLDRDKVTKRYSEAAGSRGAPHVVVGGGRITGQGLSDAHIAALSALYEAGGPANFKRFFASIRSLRSGGMELPSVAVPPERLPDAGFYHPRAPRVFEDVQQYLEWYASYRSPEPAGQQSARVAFLIHRRVISDMLSSGVDELIMRSEMEGIIPIVFWEHPAQQARLASLLSAARIDVLVNLTHMQGGDIRRNDFLELDVPVIQTLRFSEGSAADWTNAKSGIATRSTAVFLAGPEQWGVMDPLVLWATTDRREDLLTEQVDALLGKVKRIAALRRVPASEKRLALMFWNYPAGEKNLSASNLNVPRSLVSLQAALARAGFQVGAPATEPQVVAAAQRMLAGIHGTVSLDELESEGLAARYPLADYMEWLSRLPEQRRSELLQGGDPAEHWAVREGAGQPYFLIPRWELGALVVLPQPPRGSSGDAHYHDTSRPPDHLYMAAYLYVQRQHGSHALIHFGTHGTQEWLPGKERGLAVSDYPYLAAGDLPIFYPYVQDNVAEAIQAKRRGRAVVISHQTPPFAPAGLYDELRDLHQLIHEYEQLDAGMVRRQVSEQIRQAAVAAHLHEDLGWKAEDAEEDFEGFLSALHDHLHELARVAMPLGLHVFGKEPRAEHRASTIMQQLGQSYYDALGVSDDELFVDDHTALKSAVAYQAVLHVIAPDAVEAADHASAEVRPRMPDAFMPKVMEQDRKLRDNQENEMLLAGLAGRFVPPGAGGDPIRNPDVRSGRNLFAFEADKIPSRAAYVAAEQAYEQLLQALSDDQEDDYPKKIAFSLWASEAIRHLGLTEAQILHALGLRPVWDAGGRVTALDIIPAAELGRPRVDVVVHVTSVYRDQFDHFMRLLADSLERLSTLDEPGNQVALNTLNIAATLRDQGMASADADVAAQYRIFSNAPGTYGTGVSTLALESTAWQDDASLAKQFLDNGRYAFGSRVWGHDAAQINLLAEQLRGTQAVVMSRSSNVHGVLSTDHPFEFMGGLAAAVRHLDGDPAQLIISDARGDRIRTVPLTQFLADELRARYLNPHWIGAMQQEGYAGTLEVLSATNNLFGWQVMDPDTVRDDQWQAMFDTYVSDTRELGMRDWFEENNVGAQAQIIERMVEAIRKGYWDATDETRQALIQRWHELEREFDVAARAQPTRDFIAKMARGYGLEGPPEQPISDGAQMHAVQGQVLELAAATAPPDVRHHWILALIGLLFLGGAFWQLNVQRIRGPATDNRSL